MKKIYSILLLIFLNASFGQTNLILNPGFETGTGDITLVASPINNWYTAGPNTQPTKMTGYLNANRSGARYLLLDNDASSVSQTFTAVTNTVYTVTVWVRYASLTAPAANRGLTVAIRGGSSGAGIDLGAGYSTYITPVAQGIGYSKYNLIFKAPQNNLILNFSKGGSGNNPQTNLRIDDVEVKTASVWTGATNADWATATNWNTGVVPTIAADVFIPITANNPVISATGSVVSSMNIASGATVTLTASSFAVDGALAVNGTFTIAHGSVIVQNNLETNNSGNVTILRDSNLLSRLDYTMWSSPVTSSNLFLKTFSPDTVDTRFYNLDVATNKFIAVLTPATTNFTIGQGYLIRTPNNAVEAPSTQIFNGSFTGVLNTGTISKSISYTSATNSYNMVGNPYPSTIRASLFVSNNSTKIESTLYFWRRTNQETSQGGSHYATFNTTGGVGTQSGSSSVQPSGTIQIGQGFLVKAKADQTSISFLNLMREINTSTQFFKTKQNVPKDCLWLNLTNDAGAFSQMAVNYDATATLNVDDFDGKYINDSEFALTSNINNEEYTIQGRPAFDPTDVVALNFKTIDAGNYKIAIDHFVGVFGNEQDIYLMDNKTATETNLKAGSYSFTTEAGQDNTRFTLKYQKSLSVDAPIFNGNSVKVYKTNGTIYVNSGNFVINSIQVYDIQGKLIAQQRNVKKSLASIKDIKSSNQVLIVTISSEDNKTVTKKLLN